MATLPTPTGGQMVVNSIPNQAVAPSVTPKTTTTASNVSINKQIPDILSKTDNLAKTGVTTNPDGTAIHVNGTAFNPPQNDQTQAPTDYTQDPLYQQEMKNLSDFKATTDANTQNLVDTISRQYNDLFSQNASDTNLLLSRNLKSMIGSGLAFAAPGMVNSAAQQIMGNSMNKMKTLQDAEDNAIAKAKSAGDSQDYQTMLKQNDLIEKIRADKQATAQKLSDALTTKKAQATKDAAIAGVLSPLDGTAGESDPSKILEKLRANGDTTTTLKDITDTLTAIAKNNNTDLTGLTGDVKNFETLKQAGKLPASISSLPADQQLAAYIKMVHASTSAGTAAGKTGATGTSSGGGTGGTTSGGTSSGNAIGTMGSSTIDNTKPGYFTKAIVGNQTQAAIDSAALIYATSGAFPTGWGMSNTGAIGQEKDAVRNRASELSSNPNFAANKAELTANTAALKEQTNYLNSVQRALTAAEGGGQWIVKNAPAGINTNDSTFLNTKLNDLSKAFGNSAGIRSYQATLTEIGNEYAQVFARGGSRSQQGNAEAQKIIDGNISMKDLKGVLDTLQSLGKITLQASQDQVKTIQDKINGIIGGPSVTDTTHKGVSLPGHNNKITINGVTLP